MNYYPFHIGDYVSATRHLSWDEDAAYRRLLDTYYTTEKPLPAEVPKACRLVMATSEPQREAVKTVLEEFFQLTDAGWVNARADEEISAMREKVEASEEKDTHEKTRKERYRERRAFLFAFLRVHDVVPPYDIGMKELQEEATGKGWDGTFKDVPGVPAVSETGVPLAVPVERTGNVSEDATGTAIPTPTPTPIPTIKRDASVARSSSRPKKPECTLATYLDVCKAAGKKPLPPDHSIRTYCADAGISDEMLQVAWIVFRDDYVGGKNKDKRQKDWPAHFANSVKRRWYQLWYSTGDGAVEWTSTGMQEKGVIDARHKAKEQHHEPA